MAGEIQDTRRGLCRIVEVKGSAGRAKRARREGGSESLVEDRSGESCDKTTARRVRGKNRTKQELG